MEVSKIPLSLVIVHTYLSLCLSVYVYVLSCIICLYSWVFRVIRFDVAFSALPWLGSVYITRICWDHVWDFPVDGNQLFQS